MMRNKIISIIIISIIVCSNITSTFALQSNTHSNDISNTITTNLEDGSYTIENDALHIDKDKESVARKYINPISKTEVKDGIISVIFSFTEKDVINNTKFTLDDKEINYEIINEDEKTIDYKLIINNIEDILKVNANIKTSIFPNPMNVDFRMKLKSDTLTKADGDNGDIEKPDENLDGDNGDIEKPDENLDGDNGNIEKPDENSDGDNENIENPDENLGEDTNNDNQEGDNSNQESNSGDGNQSNEQNSQVNGYKNGTYKMNNKVLTDSKIGYDAARQSLNTINYMEVKNNKMYIRLGFGQTNLMKNIRVLVNGKNVSHTTLNKNSSKHTMDIKFEAQNLKSDVIIKLYIPAIEQDISFGVEFIESSVVKISEELVNTPLGTQVLNSSLANIGNNLKDNTNNDKQESKIDKGINSTLDDKYIKRYSIENDVVHDSAIGKRMARKYLYEISYIDEDDSNQKYLTITFSDTGVMDNFRINVNGKDVEFETVDSSDSVKSFKFKIDNVTDNIQFFMYIKPVKMNIDFKIQLLEETMKLLDEKEVSAQNIVNDLNVEKVDVFKIAITTSIMTIILLSTLFLIFFRVYIKKQRKQNL